MRNSGVLNDERCTTLNMSLFKNHLIVIFAGIIILLCITLVPTSVHGIYHSWNTDQISISRDPLLSSQASDYGVYGDCTDQTISIQDYYGNYIERVECVYVAKSYKYAIINDTGMLYIGVSNDNKLYPLHNQNFGNRRFVRPSPNTNDFIYDVSLIRDLPSKITLHESSGKLSYQLLADSIVVVGRDENGFQHNSNVSAVSRNGEWMVVNFENLGIVRFNLTNLKATWISKFRSFNEFMAISNDGDSVAVAPLGGYASPLIINTNSCGQSSPKLSSQWFIQNYEINCEIIDLRPLIEMQLGAGLFTSNAVPEFSDDNNELLIHIFTHSEGMGLRISKSISTTQHKLDYLALGDSYSSGRGDIEKDENGLSYYTNVSNGPNGCHISTRSYPFLLRNMNNIPDDRMRSVACAGARVHNDYFGDSSGYLGQSGQLRGLNESQASNYREVALDEYHPGILKQLDFVKATLPKAVTITGGGNDIGFSDVIKSCVLTPGLSNRMSTCDEAIEGSDKNSIIGDAIQSQFEPTIKLISEIKRVSPATTIYIVGYPKFIADNAKRCVNGVMLNQQEMTTINKAVEYLNMVLQAAAETGGARYVDVEESLSGGRLCEGSDYMTGLLSVRDTDYIAEMFHPNSRGHARMAASIQSAGFTVASYNNPASKDTSVPPKPLTFGKKAHVPTFVQKIVPEAMMIAGGAHPLAIAANSILSGEDTITFTLRSKPVSLGMFKADADGSLNGQLVIPSNVELGIHMLVADIKSADGTTKRFFQYVEVRSPNPLDRDGDGISDDKDNCLYIKRWYDEQTGEDICTYKPSRGITPRGWLQGRGHWYGNGLHTGHGGHDQSLVL